MVLKVECADDKYVIESKGESFKIDKDLLDKYVDGNCWCCGQSRIVKDGRELCVDIGKNVSKCKYAGNIELEYPDGKIERVLGCDADDKTDGNCKGRLDLSKKTLFIQMKECTPDGYKLVKID